MSSTMYFGHGQFSRISEVGVSGLENSSETIMKCIDDILCNYEDDDSSPFTIADYGTADGSMSVPILNKMIRILQKKRGKDKEIFIILEDQAENDFNSLFNVINGSTKHKENMTALHKEKNVFVSVIGNTMYEQCLPKKSVDLVISSMALHFLSKIPCHIKNGISLGTADKDEYTEFKNAAEKDWKFFLLNRGKELKPGGQMILLVLGTDEKGNSSLCVHGNDKTLAEIAERLVDENVFTKEEYTSMTFCSYRIRTKEEMTKIFDKDTDIKDLGLQLKSFIFKTAIYIPGLSLNEKTDEFARKSYAKRTAGLNRACFHHTIYRGLSHDRSEEEKQNIADMYFKRVEEFAFNSDSFPPLYSVYAEIVVSKEKC